MWHAATARARALCSADGVRKKIEHQNTSNNILYQAAGIELGIETFGELHGIRGFGKVRNMTAA